MGGGQVLQRDRRGLGARHGHRSVPAVPGLAERHGAQAGSGRAVESARRRLLSGRRGLLDDPESVHLQRAVPRESGSGLLCLRSDRGQCECERHLGTGIPWQCRCGAQPDEQLRGRAAAGRSDQVFGAPVAGRLQRMHHAGHRHHLRAVEHDRRQLRARSLARAGTEDLGRCGGRRIGRCRPTRSSRSAAAVLRISTSDGRAACRRRSRAT